MRTRLLHWGLLVAAWAASASDLPRPDDPDPLTPADRAAMLVLVRRAAATREPIAFAPEQMPAKLLRATGRPLVLSAHRAGQPPAVAMAPEGTLFEQLTRVVASLRAAGALRALPAVRFKIDVVTRLAPVGLGAGGQPVAGIHGVRVRAPRVEIVLPPSEGLRPGLGSGDALVREALRRAQAAGARAGETTVERFAATSFMEGSPGGRGTPVDLYRGMPLVGRVSARSARAACEAAADWLLRFQQPDGRFHYLYNGMTDTASDEGYCAVRHAGTAWSLAQAFGSTGHRRFRQGAYRALEWLLARTGSRDDMAWVAYDGHCTLGASALAVVGLLEYRAAVDTRRFDPLIRRLGRFIVFMQSDDGFFASHYDPRTHRGAIPDGHVPLYAPGEAFLALVRLQAALPDPAWERAVAKAADFAATRRDAWYQAHDLPMIHPDAWTMMAIDEFHALGAARRAHTDYAFFLAEQIVREQETPATARWRDHVGAPRTTAEPPHAGVAAARCEGLLAAWRLARRMGVSAEPYRRAALLSARFQLAHQFTATNDYLLPAPERARGAFFASYADPSARVDTVQHNLSALLGIATLLAAERED